MVNQCDFFALQAPVFFFTDVLKHHIGGCPVSAQQRKVPLKHRAIDGLRQTIAHRFNRHFVVESLVSHREGNARRLRVKTRSARTAVFKAFIAFNTFGGVISGFAFFKLQFHAIDAAITGINQFEVIGFSIGPGNTQWRELAGAVHQQRHKLLNGLGVGRAHGRKTCRENGNREG